MIKDYEGGTPLEALLGMVDCAPDFPSSLETMFKYKSILPQVLKKIDLELLQKLQTLAKKKDLGYSLNAIKKEITTKTITNCINEKNKTLEI
jgi:hypothetical protein